MFEQLAVDPSVARAIDDAVQQNRLPHALILEGGDDLTRLAAAREIAQALVCESADKKPCGVCKKCRKVLAGSHPDLYLIEPEKEGAFIKVDAIRALKSHALLRPNDGEKSVFLIREAQMMNVQSQNALLKILEEPAPHVCILLTCPSKAALLETILSRATAFALSNETAGDTADLQTACDLLRILCAGNELDLLLALAPLQKDRDAFRAVLSAVQPILRDALLPQGTAALLSGAAEESDLLKKTLTQKQMLDLMDTAQSSLDALERNANLNLLLTCFCSRCCEIRFS